MDAHLVFRLETGQTQKVFLEKTPVLFGTADQAAIRIAGKREGNLLVSLFRDGRTWFVAAVGPDTQLEMGGRSVNGSIEITTGDRLRLVGSVFTFDCGTTTGEVASYRCDLSIKGTLNVRGTITTILEKRITGAATIGEGPSVELELPGTGLSTDHNSGFAFFSRSEEGTEFYLRPTIPYVRRDDKSCPTGKETLLKDGDTLRFGRIDVNIRFVPATSLSEREENDTKARSVKSKIIEIAPKVASEKNEPRQSDGVGRSAKAGQAPIPQEPTAAQQVVFKKLVNKFVKKKVAAIRNAKTSGKRRPSASEVDAYDHRVSSVYDAEFADTWIAKAQKIDGGGTAIQALKATTMVMLSLGAVVTVLLSLAIWATTSSSPWITGSAVWLAHFALVYFTIWNFESRFKEGDLGLHARRALERRRVRGPGLHDVAFKALLITMILEYTLAGIGTVVIAVILWLATPWAFLLSMTIAFLAVHAILFVWLYSMEVDKKEDLVKSNVWSREEKAKSHADFATKYARKQLHDLQEIDQAIGAHLGSAAQALDRAEILFKKRSFSPFWENIEQVNDEFESVAAMRDKAMKCEREYDKQLKGELHNFPRFPEYDAQYKESLKLARHLAAWVSKGQGDFEFASILEQRRGNSKTESALKKIHSDSIRSNARMAEQIEEDFDELRRDFFSFLDDD